MSNNKHRLMSSLTEATVIGALMQNLDWVYLPKVSLKQSDFSTVNHQVIYSILRDKYLEDVREISPEQLALEAEKHAMSGKHTVTIEICRNYKSIIDNVTEKTFVIESERLNKLRVLRELDEQGYDVIKIIGDDHINAPKITSIIDQLPIQDILNIYRKEIDDIAENIGVTKTVTSVQAADGLEELIAELRQAPQVGRLMDGNIFNSVVRGALLGKYYINSSPTGVGKTRMMLGNAAALSMPKIAADGTIEYRAEGYEKVLFITTELTPMEIQTMLVANVSGVPEDKITTGGASFEEESRISLAIKIIQEYNDHLYIEQISDPSVMSVVSKAEVFIRRHNIQYLFFDYIFESSALIMEYPKSRADVALMHFSNALKEVAADNNIFVMSATQVNDKWKEDSYRDQSVIRGSKAIADKIDTGYISLDISDEDFLNIEAAIEALGCKKPNMVTDIYKNRASKYNIIKIFRYFDKSTCRMEDLFMTNSRYEVISMDRIFVEEVINSSEVKYIERREEEE